ncbi:TolC family protein [Thermosulfurimonas sp.]|uniref:TolC family protein n=1 Tax=Thermosulfurimonas sp. TaxID=2080236 RepID=UPI0025D68EED|nr:TolC family protein [Thermosulfurimonas sp.]
MRRILPWVLIWLCLLSRVSPAGERVFSLRECLRLALSRYPALKAALARVRASEEREKAAFREHLPRLYTGYDYRRYRDRETLTTPFGSYPIRGREEALFTVTVKLPVFHGLSISLRHRLRKLEVNLSRIEEARTRQELIFRVKEAYFRLVQAEREVELARKSLERRRAHLRDVQGFFRQGLVARNQVLQTQAEVQEAEYRLLSAENRLRIAASRLNLLLQRPLSAPIRVKPEFPLEPVNLSYDQLLRMALSHRPEVKSAVLAVKLKEKELGLARSRYFPWLDLQAQYYVRGDRPDLSENPYGDRENLWVGFSLRWELWDWGIRAREMAAVRAEILSRQALLREIRDRVGLEVREAYLKLLAARKKIQVARSALAAARENFRLNRARFREGLADTTEVMDAETLLTRAQTQEIAALADYEISRARLAYAVGLPDLPRGSPTPPADHPHAEKTQAE